ncbi:MAG: hypothetical protein ACKPJL_10985, partial [Microcystis panniformis]
MLTNHRLPFRHEIRLLFYRLFSGKVNTLPAPQKIPTLEALCFAEFGDTGIAYIAAPVLADPLTGKRRYSYAVRGIWVTWVKAAFEEYFLQKLRWGMGVPWFERWGLRLLFGLS